MKWLTGSCFLVAALVLASGCDPSGKPGDSSVKKPEPKAAPPKQDHSGWWCREHGIPEEECSMCLPEEEVEKRFKSKKDWCDKHERARSQCFLCEPALKEVFAAKYRAKYGKEPPPIEEP